MHKNADSLVAQESKYLAGEYNILSEENRVKNIQTSQGQVRLKINIKVKLWFETKKVKILSHESTAKEKPKEVLNKLKTHSLRRGGFESY